MRGKIFPNCNSALRTLAARLPGVNFLPRELFMILKSFNAKLPAGAPPKKISLNVIETPFRNCIHK